MAGLTKRIFLGSGAAILLLGAGSRIACQRKTVQVSRNYQRLDVFLPELPDPERIGRSFRERIGLDRLHAHAADNACISRAIALDCETSRLSILREGIRDEFRRGEIVLCDRFVLSVTECLVAGLRFDAGNVA